MLFEKKTDWEKKKQTLIKKCTNLENYAFSEDNSFKGSFFKKEIIALNLSNDSDQNILQTVEFIFSFVDILKAYRQQCESVIFYIAEIVGKKDDTFDDYLWNIKNNIYQYNLSCIKDIMENTRNSHYMELTLFSIMMIACIIALAVLSHPSMTIMISLITILSATFLKLAFNLNQLKNIHHDNKELNSIQISMRSISNA